MFFISTKKNLKTYFQLRHKLTQIFEDLRRLFSDLSFPSVMLLVTVVVL